MPDLPPEEEFEDTYTGKLRLMLVGHGIELQYKRDRAAIDMGLHLTKQDPSGVKRPTTTKVWFQLKGKHAASLPLEEFQEAETVPVDVKINDLQLWYASPEPVYLVLYVESADVFLAEDVREIVDRQWGEAILNRSTFRPGQVEARVHLRTEAILDGKRIELMLSHRSMRIDGPHWRGRPLGHRLDPLRSEIDPLAPKDYRALVERLLDVHRYEGQEELDPSTLLGGISDGSDLASLTRGRMHQTYEWTHPMFTEFGYDPDDRFRIEGTPLYVQGACAVLIHEQVVTHPGTGTGFSELARRLLNEHGVGQLLVFVNQATSLSGQYIGGCRTAARPLECMPQDLGSLTFNLLVATIVYLEFREKISWRLVNYVG